MTDPDGQHTDGQRTDGQQTDAEDRAIDLDAIERDLDGVEVALQRLDAGTYWTDELTGQRLPDALLETDPTARRLA